MATNEPMTTERIYEIDALQVFLDETEVDEAQEALRDLLLEVRRLRAREQALAAEIAAMRPVVEALAKWGIGGGLPVEFYHQARAFVAAHPATDTAAGEAESEA